MDEENSVTEEDIEHIASIARIDISEINTSEFIDQFQSILSRLDKLSDVNRTAEDAGELTNVTRPDDVRGSLTAKEAVQNTDETDDGYFEGPPVS